MLFPRTLHGFSLILVCVWLTHCTANSTSTVDPGENIPARCDTARRKYRTAGYEDDDIYAIRQDDTRLVVCEKLQTCCKHTAELKLAVLSEKVRKELIVPVEQELKLAVSNCSVKFRDHFESLITNSQQNLDQMFMKTYGTRYEDNAQVFKSLYISLRQYLNGSELNLQSTVDNFFASLFQKVYVMSQPFNKFDANYKTCIQDSTSSIMPFGDVARKISVQTLRSFLASRVFLQGLKVGLDVSKKLLHLPVHDACAKSFTRMTTCSLCGGIDNIKPCSGYCSNVMKGCFVYIMMIQPKWNSFLKEMVQLADKLQGPFSMESVIGPLGVKISEAIMLFQDNQNNITKKVVQRCGMPSEANAANPVNTKRHRKAVDSKKFLDELKNVAKDQDINLPFLTSFANSQQPKDKMETETERLVREAKAILSSALDYWIRLPERMCSDGLAAPPGSSDCWNGRNSSGYHRAVVSDSISDLFQKNPEIDLNLNTPNVDVLALANELQYMRYRIQGALEGNDKRNEVDEAGSGSTTDGGTDDEDDCASGESGDGRDGSGEGSGCSPSRNRPPTGFPRTVRPGTTRSPNDVEPVDRLPAINEVEDPLQSLNNAGGRPSWGLAGLALSLLPLAIGWQFR